MKKTFKKIISALLVAVMVSGVLASGISNEILLIEANAEETTVFTEGFYTYNVENGEATITDVDTSISGDVVIPSALGGYPVTKIGGEAFYRNKNLTSIIIPDGVTTIGGYAFNNCSFLANITIPDSVVSIGNSAFSGCDSLTNITLSDNVVSIGKFAFNNCSMLTNITVDSGNPAYSSDEYGVLFNKDKTELIQYPIGNTRTNYEIPTNVATIIDDAFSGCNSLTSISINATHIKQHAFLNCDGLTNIIIGNRVTETDYGPFYSCDSLTSITVDSENPAFSSDEYGVLFNKDKTLLEQYPIGNTRTNYTIPDSVTGFCAGAFKDCSFLTNITIPESVTGINAYTFAGCTGLTSITIPDSVTTIASSAFAACAGLTSITIGNGITNIYNFAFYNCPTLTDIYYNGTEEEWNAISIGSGNNPVTNAKIHFNYVEDEYTDSGACGDNLTWKYYESTGELVISGTGDMWNWNSSPDVPWFNLKSSIKFVSIGDNVTNIGNYAFGSCPNLTNITIPQSVTSIGYHAFFSCSGLTSILIPDSVKHIDDGAFIQCGFTSITIPKSVTSMGTDVFTNCRNLTSITVDPENTSYSSDDYGVLFDKDKTILIQYPIGTKRTVYTVPDNTTNIELRAFSACSNLTSITLPDNLIGIGMDAFRGCSSLTDVYYSGSEEEWNTITIGVGNDCLTNAKIHFNYNDPKKLVFNLGYDDKTIEYSLIPGEKIILPEVPQRKGYEFVGWTTEIPETMPAEDLTVTAVWKANTYDAVFMVDGEIYETVPTKFNEKIATPSVPEKEGYTFEGWTPAIGTMDDINGKTFTAVWTVNKYKVTFMFKDEIYAENLVNYSENIILPDTNNIEGYEFVCWLDENGNVANIPSKMPAENLVYNMKYSTVCKNTEFDVSVTFDEEIFGDNISIVVNDQTTQSDMHAYFKANISGNSSIKKIYNICLMKDDKILDLNDHPVTVKIKVSEDFSNQDFSVAHKPGNSKYPFEYYKSSENEARYEDGYIIFEVTHFSYFAVCIENDVPTIKIRNNPVESTVNYGDILSLTAETANMSEGMQVVWYVNGEKTATGNAFKSEFKKDAEITVKITDLDGNIITDENGDEVSDSQKVTVKDNFWLRIVSFFKNLFGISRLIEQ